MVYPTQEQMARAHSLQVRPVVVAERDFQDYLRWERQQKGNEHE